MLLLAVDEVHLRFASVKGPNTPLIFFWPLIPTRPSDV